MAVKGQEIVSVIRKQIKDFGADLSVENVGTVVEVGDGIATVHGLSNVGANELVEFDGGIIEGERLN